MKAIFQLLDVTTWNRLVVLLKAPRLGFVKTRLAATLGESAALAAYQEMVSSLLATIAELPSVELRFTPDEAVAELRAWQRPTWILAPQGAGDLGARLAHAFAQNFSTHARKVIVIGSDCPDLAVTDLAEALDALDDSDLALGPARDGGYWLVGLRAPRPWLFRGITWGSSQVYKQTVIKAEAGGLRVHRLRELSDIDVEADLLAWRHRTPVG